MSRIIYKKSPCTEKQLTLQIAEYMQYRHPKIMYRFDLAAGIKLHKSQAVYFKKLHPTRGHPDLTIYHPSGGWHGLCVELKTEDKSPYLKNGELSRNKHVQEQAEYLKRLEASGYKAVFAVGLKDFIDELNHYLFYEHS